MNHLVGHGRFGRLPGLSSRFALLRRVLTVRFALLLRLQPSLCRLGASRFLSDDSILPRLFGRGLFGLVLRLGGCRCGGSLIARGLQNLLRGLPI